MRIELNIIFILIKPRKVIRLCMGVYVFYEGDKVLGIVVAGFPVRRFLIFLEDSSKTTHGACPRTVRRHL